jgi:manganese/zinc/iron transport system permease protein
MADSIWIIVTASLIALSCALVGNYLVLRNQAMLGDALSHAILPGLLFAFLLFGMQNTIAYVLSCSLFGVLSIALIDLLKQHRYFNDDVAIGLSFTSFFALGVILISLFAGKVHLDYDHVLYGEIAYVPIDVWILESGSQIGPRSFWIALILLITCLLFIAVSYRFLLISSFSEELAKMQKINPRLWHYLLLSFCSIVVVVSFESVGAILVVSFLIIPSSTAYLISKSLKYMILYSFIVAVGSCVLGYFLATLLNSSIAASMAVVSGIIFTLTFTASYLRKSLG